MKTLENSHCLGCDKETPTGERFCAACRVNPVHLGFSLPALEKAFDEVKDSTNWKNPIHKCLRRSLDRQEKALINAAVEFYAGCPCTFKDRPASNSTIVEAPGYYVAVGA